MATFFKSFPRKSSLVFLQIVITLVLLFAFSLELLLNIHPCSLCLLQRITLTVILLLTLVLPYKKFIILGFFCNMAVSLYQMLLQYKILKSTCNISFSESNLPNCDLIDISFFGVSLAGYNVVLSVILIIFVIKYYKPPMRK